jgi:hypothetical protein
MNEKYYTPDGSHPDDAIYKAKAFINELQKVQEQYFTKLTQELKLSKEGEDWLFDFIFNSSEDENYDGFEHYLSDFGKEYNDIVSRDIMFNNSVDNLLSTDFGEFSPMIHMSSYEPDLETAFPSSYEDINLPVSSLDTITIQSSGTEVGYY